MVAVLKQELQLTSFLNTSECVSYNTSYQNSKQNHEIFIFLKKAFRIIVVIQRVNNIGCNCSLPMSFIVLLLRRVIFLIAVQEEDVNKDIVRVISTDAFNLSIINNL